VGWPFARPPAPQTLNADQPGSNEGERAVIAKHADHVEHLDGAGVVHRYRLVPLPLAVED
jgi:hypothetical protein